MDNLEIRKKKMLSAEFFIGLFCIGAICILFYFTVIVRGKDFFFQAEKVNVTVQFPRAGTLAVNDKVKVIGVEMGQVKKIELAPDNNSVLVTLQVRKQVTLNEDYEISIQNTSVFGGVYVSIVPGVRMDAPINLDNGPVLVGKEPVDLLAKASQLITHLTESEEKLRNMFDDEFLADLKSAVKNFDDNFETFNQLFRDLRDGKGTMGKLFTDETLYEDLKSSLANMSSSSDNLNVLLSDMREGKGTLGKLAQDETVYNSLVESLNSVNTLSKKLTEAEGSLGKFMNDDGKLYTSLESALTNLDTLSQNMTEGKGTLGKLMSDESLYVEFKDTVRQLRAAIEDFREMTPIATFGSIALGAL